MDNNNYKRKKKQFQFTVALHFETMKRIFQIMFTAKC